MPAKTVVFTSVRKFDGEVFRWIGGGEYIQMSGRAGRRGLDKKGITILMIDEKMEPEAAKSMLKGKSDNLVSSFYISYNMLLNSQRLEDIDPDFILSRTLLQHQQEANLPKLYDTYNSKYSELQSFQLENEHNLESLYLLIERLTHTETQLKKLTYSPQNIMKFLNIGRLVEIKSNTGDINWGLGCIINFKKEKSTKRQK